MMQSMRWMAAGVPLPAERSRAVNRAALIAGGILGGLALAAIAAGIAGGSISRDIAIVAFLAAPFALYLALTKPLVFPYTLYIFFVPFDTFLGFSKFGTLTKILGMVTGTLLLLYCIRIRHIVLPRAPLAVLLCLLAWMFASSFWAVSPDAVGPWLATYGALALLYTALVITPATAGDFKTIIITIAVAFLLSAIMAVAFFRPAPGEVFPNPDAARAIVTFGGVAVDPNEYADAMLFPFAILIGLATRNNYLIGKLAFLAAAFIMVDAILVTGSREALVGLVVVILYYLIRSRYRAQFALLISAVIALAAPLSSTVIWRFQQALNTGGAGRDLIWATGLKGATHYGIFGAGLGNFPTVYNRFLISTAMHSKEFYGWDAPAHNVLLQFFVELGIVGLGLFIAFIVANFLMLRSIPRDHPLYDYRVIVEGGLLAICATSLFIGSFNDKWVWLVFATAAQLSYVASTYKAAPLDGTVRDAQEEPAAVT